ENGSLSVSSQFGLGDLNGDGIINAVDASLALQVATQQLTPTALQHNACDVNGDRTCDTGDAILILCYDVHRDWVFCLSQNVAPSRLTTQAVLTQSNV